MDERPNERTTQVFGDMAGAQHGGTKTTLLEVSPVATVFFWKLGCEASAVSVYFASIASVSQGRSKDKNNNAQRKRRPTSSTTSSFFAVTLTSARVCAGLRRMQTPDIGAGPQHSVVT